MLAAHAAQKELAVLAVGIILYFKYTTDMLEGFFFLLESTDKVNIGLWRVATI